MGNGLFFIATDIKAFSNPELSGIAHEEIEQACFKEARVEDIPKTYV